MNVFNACVKFLFRLFVSGFFSAQYVLAQAEQSSEAAKRVVEPVGSLGKVVLMLVLVIALILFIAWLLNKTRSLNFMGQTGVIKTLAVMPLGVKEKVALVQVGDKQLILGITSQQINCLGELDTPIEDSLASQQQANSFADLLKRAIKK